MTSSIRPDTQAFLDWLSSDPNAGRQESDRLLAFPAEGWDEYLAGHPLTLNWHAVQRLLQHAHHLLGIDPAQSAAITELLVRHVDRFPLTAGTEVAAEMQRIAVWRERAEALQAVGDVPAALAAAERGVAAAHTDQRHYALERAEVRRVVAAVLHKLGRDLEALRILEEDLTVFEEHDDGGGLLRSLLALADLQLALRHLPRAHETLQRASALATARADEPQQTQIRQKQALCEELLDGGRSARAR